MQYIVSACFIFFSLHISAQDENILHEDKLPGNSYIEIHYRLLNGEQQPDNYKKNYLLIENEDSIEYLEKYNNPKEWSVTRYKRIDNKTILSGWQRFYNMDGTLQYEQQCADGKKLCPEMVRYAWYPGGQLLAMGRYYKNQEDGSYFYFYSNGQLRQHAWYKKGLFMEVLAYYDQQGNPMDAGNLCEGEGFANVYSATGKIIQMKTFKNGKVKKMISLSNSEN